MIKVIEEKEVPRGTVVCESCGSVLEYGNADLHEVINYNYGISGVHNYALRCPVCGCEQSASWVQKSDKSKKTDGKICPKCGEKMILDKDVVYTSNPVMYGYKCPKCGKL